MRIAHVTNYWPNRHGHAHYTQNLMTATHAHRPIKQYVIGEGATGEIENDVYAAAPYWSRSDDYIDDVMRGLCTVRADVAYLQYSNDLFGADERFPKLLAAMTAAGIRSVVVTHSVYPAEGRSRHPGRTIGAFDVAVGNAASCVHVHSPRMADELVARGIDPAKIAVIPHGSLALPTRDPAESRAALGIPAGAKVVLFFGFIWTGKGLGRLIAAFARLHERVPEAYLYIGGHTRWRKWGFYVKYLQLRGLLAGCGGAMRAHGAYVPDDAVPTVYSAGDVVAMPYRQDYASVSGVVHQTAGMGKLMLCSNIAKFDEVGAHISPDLLVPPDDTEAWAAGLERLLTDEVHARDMRARILAFADATSWPRVAAQHLALCDRLVAQEAAAC